jgi:hypothetical protein
MLFRSSLLSFGLLTALVPLAGCSYFDTFEDPYVPTSESKVIEIAPVAPPALSTEDAPLLADHRAQVWRKGHWVYQDQRFAWVPGEVLTRPSPTAVWSPDRWERRTYGWVFIHGYWQ